MYHGFLKLRVFPRFFRESMHPKIEISKNLWAWGPTLVALQKKKTEKKNIRDQTEVYSC